MAAYYGVHLWNICEPVMIKKILTAKPGHKFMSDTFKLCDLLCKLVIFPNGKSSTQKGSLIVFLCILTIPKPWHDITLNWSLKCTETMCQVNGISIFSSTTKNRNVRWSNRMLLLHELKQISKLKKISFEVTINTLIIHSNNNQLLYQFTPYNHMQRRHKLSWHCDEQVMSQFKDPDACYYGKRYSQPISISQMWSIGCFPYGFNKKWNGFVSLSLQLNFVPIGVRRMVVKFTLKCVDIEYSKTRVKEYSLMHQHNGIVDFCESKYIQHLDTMHFEALIEILHVFDSNDKEIVMSKNELRKGLRRDEEKVKDRVDEAMECAVQSWLKNTVRLSQYVDNFLLHGFDDMEVIKEAMDINDLYKIGINKLGHRKRIMLHIDRLKSEHNDPHLF
eukprot:75979_1